MIKETATVLSETPGSKISWTIKGGRVLGPAPFLIAGIINATPDSFYDGGKHEGVFEAIAHGHKLISEETDILDIGGESTRPFSDPVPADVEIKRVLPVIKELQDTGIPLSIDTYKSEVARKALQAGAHIVNDVSACRFDPDLLQVLTDFKPGYVLMHSLGTPKDMQVDPAYENVVEEVQQFFEDGLKTLTTAGLPEDRIVLDPGIGFGKKLEHNLSLIKNIHRFLIFGRPVFIGLSNKSLWEKLLNLPLNERSNATQVATAITAQKGAGIHRVHDVGLTRQTLRIVHAMK